jgi:probable phosphoglycerate mutase
MPVANHRPTQFVIMRHAPTEWNRQGRIQGQQDSPLTPAGQGLIASWCRHLSGVGLSRIISSDLGRAKATAGRLGASLKLPLSVDRRLREQDWGQWTGKRHRQLKQEARHEYRRQAARGWFFQPPGGESHLQVLERGLAALQDIAAAHPGERLLLVTHEGWMKCLLYHLAIRDGCGHKPVSMAPYHLHRLIITRDQLVLDRVNWLDLMAAPSNDGRPAAG